VTFSFLTKKNGINMPKPLNVGCLCRNLKRFPGELLTCNYCKRECHKECTPFKNMSKQQIEKKNPDFKCSVCCNYACRICMFNLKINLFCKIKCCAVSLSVCLVYYVYMDMCVRYVRTRVGSASSDPFSESGLATYGLLLDAKCRS
jgi:hypothetical protein